MFFKKKRQPGWLAIETGEETINLVHVRRAPMSRPEIAWCESFRKEGTDAAALARLRKRFKLDQYRCTTLLGTRDYQLHELEAPNVPAAELKSAVRFSLKDNLDYPLEEAMVDVLAIPADPGAAPGPRAIYAVTARKNAIERCAGPFAEARIALEAIDIPDLAQRNIAALFEPEGIAIAMLACHNNESMFTLSCGDELYVARHFDIPLGRMIAGSAERRTQYFERLALELQRTLDRFDGQHGNIPVGKLLLAPLPQEIGLAQYLAGIMPLPVEPIDFAAQFDFPGVPDLKQPERQWHCLRAIGAAMRDEAAA